MPFNDGTGPNGQGPRTGRGRGNCAGQGGAGRPLGLGRGRRGGGRGFGVNAGQGNSWIQTQIDELKAVIQKLTERLDEGKKE